MQACLKFIAMSSEAEGAHFLLFWCMSGKVRKMCPGRLRVWGCPDIKDEDVRDVAAAVIWDGEGPGRRRKAT